MTVKGITSVVINAEHLAREAEKGRELWAEARSGKFQVIALAPEALVSDWGPDFRDAYEEIWTIRAHAPKDLTVVALSATLEPGRQTERVLSKLGFSEGKYHLDRRDCERHNVNYIFREVSKFILFSNTIETGHRIAVYLRSLLPPGLQNDKYTLIRHMHSMTCPDCKQDGITARCPASCHIPRSQHRFIPRSECWSTRSGGPRYSGRGLRVFYRPSARASLDVRPGEPDG